MGMITPERVKAWRAQCLEGQHGLARLFFHASEGLAAFNLEGLNRDAAKRVVRRVLNQHGASYTFDDGTRWFVTRGYPQRQRAYDAHGVGVAARPG